VVASWSKKSAAAVKVTAWVYIRPLSRSWPIIVGWLKKITGG